MKAKWDKHRISALVLPCIPSDLPGPGAEAPMSSTCPSWASGRPVAVGVSGGPAGRSERT
eukprot:6700742-Prorocentrum_lima.AAC.1